MKKLLNYHGIILLFLFIGSSCKDEGVVKDEDELIVNISSKLILDNVNGTDVVIVGNPSANFIVSFELQLSNGDIPNLSVVNGRLPIIMEDDKGNLYDITGRIVSGDMEGHYLLPVLSYQSYWFAIAAFFPGVEIYQEGGEIVDLDLNTNPEWAIPTNNLFVGTGFDAIPAIDEPKFTLINDAGPNIDLSLLPAGDDLIIGIIVAGEPIAYPHNILNWHEILNQDFRDYAITLSFCPLTGTAIAWKGANSFGVSGLLYNSNLIAYDRETESFWSQMLASSIRGDLREEKLNTISLVETEWNTWRVMYPNTKLLTTETGYVRDYDTTPYRGYAENDNLIYYPLDYYDDRLPNKDRVHVIIKSNQAKVYTFDHFKL